MFISIMLQVVQKGGGSQFDCIFLCMIRDISASCEPILIYIFLIERVYLQVGSIQIWLRSVL